VGKGHGQLHMNVSRPTVSKIVGRSNPRPMPPESESSGKRGLRGGWRIRFMRRSNPLSKPPQFGARRQGLEKRVVRRVV